MSKKIVFPGIHRCASVWFYRWPSDTCPGACANFCASKRRIVRRRVARPKTIVNKDSSDRQGALLGKRNSIVPIDLALSRAADKTCNVQRQATHIDIGDLETVHCS